MATLYLKGSIRYLKGFIRDGTYTPCLNPEKFEEYDIAQFDVNQAQAYGLINLGTQGNNLAFSKWVSPKRTRTYPFARIYNTFHFNTKKITIIPIIKDEGAGTLNNDRINFITLLQKAKNCSSKTTKKESLFSDSSYLNRYLWHDAHISNQWC